MKILKFSASWCMPCRALAVIIDRAKSKIDIDIDDIDIDDQPEMSMQFNVRGVPTLVLVDAAGKEIKRHVGMITEERLLEWLE